MKKVKIGIEVGLALDKPVEFYIKMLKDNGLENTFNCNTRDIYYTNLKTFDGLTEQEIKYNCVRLRILDGIDGTRFHPATSFERKVQNYKIFDKSAEKNKFHVTDEELIEYESKLLQAGWKKIFDTKKTDYQFENGIQLQVIENVGLLVYYADIKYAGLDLEKQFELLYKDLEQFGFTFIHKLGVDKLKTLYYNKKHCSKFQDIY